MMCKFTFKIPRFSDLIKNKTQINFGELTAFLYNILTLRLISCIELFQSRKAGLNNERLSWENLLGLIKLQLLHNHLFK